MATKKRSAAGKKAARKPVARKAAKKPANKAVKKAAKTPAKKTARKVATASARTPSKTSDRFVKRKKAPYAIHLTFKDYERFAKAITHAIDGEDKPYLRTDKRKIEDTIKQELQKYNAQVLTACDGTSHNFDPKKDKIKVEIDNDNVYQIAIPAFICEDKDGHVDIEYLRNYVREMRNPSCSEDEAAWSLLGMYFLSRCR
jgi:hypothetical protein